MKRWGWGDENVAFTHEDKPERWAGLPDAVPVAERDPLDDYGAVRSAIQRALVDSGATLSYHHAAGTEHAEWLAQDISEPGAAMLRALFEASTRSGFSTRGSTSDTIGDVRLEGPSVRIVAVPVVVAKAPREPVVQPVLLER